MGSQAPTFGTRPRPSSSPTQRPRQPGPDPEWQVAWTILPPRPQGMNRGCIKTAPPWWMRLARQVIPRRATRDCCYYPSDVVTELDARTPLSGPALSNPRHPGIQVCWRRERLPQEDS